MRLCLSHQTAAPFRASQHAKQFVLCLPLAALFRATACATRLSIPVDGGLPSEPAAVELGVSRKAGSEPLSTLKDITPCTEDVATPEMAQDVEL